jgi:hypothetical protein
LWFKPHAFLFMLRANRALNRTSRKRGFARAALAG